MRSATRQVKLFRNGRNQALRIPREFELDGNRALVHREGERLIVQPLRKGRLVTWPRGEVAAAIAERGEASVCTSVVVAAELRAYLERAGTPIGPNDMLIAAHALALGLIVVSGNDREFARVPGLAVDNWLA